LDRSRVRSARYRPVKKALTWVFFADFFLLGWVGTYQPDTVSFIGVSMHRLGLVFTIYYYLYFLTMPFISSVEPVTGGEEAP
ncbi:MAG: hypothetical protein Q8P48_04410, partial [Deltaproteobacteria bacterium]|nr:hypothetical protein [Deltaproteobacteria bacterium]